MKIEFDGRTVVHGLFILLIVSVLVTSAFLLKESHKTQVTKIVHEQPIIQYYPQDIIIEINTTTDEQRIRFNGVEQK